MLTVGIGATSPLGLTCKYLPLAEAISSAPNTSRIACHLRIPTLTPLLLIPQLFNFKIGDDLPTQLNLYNNKSQLSIIIPPSYYMVETAISETQKKLTQKYQQEHTNFINSVHPRLHKIVRNEPIV